MPQKNPLKNPQKSPQQHPPHRGRCLCGAVRFRVEAPITTFVHCHCTQCRKASGTAFTSNATVRAADFVLEAGADELRAHESSPGVQRWFCTSCGSPVYKTRGALPEALRLRLGLLDTPLLSRAAAHIWVEAKADWFAITDDLPQYPQALPDDGSRS